MKKFSIIVPVFQNELSLPETIPRLLKLKDELPDYELEFVFVDDGSTDRSLEILLDHKKKYPKNIRVVKLTRNFGGPNASQAGFTVASGDCVGKISADLQDPPELFIDMIKHWEKGNKAVFAVSKNRKDPLLSRFFSSMYYSLIRRLAIHKYPKGGFDFLLVDKQIVNEINKIKEKNTNINTLIFWMGYKNVKIPYTRETRKKGKSQWTLSKKIKLVIDTFVAFSYFPIRLLSVLGIIFAIAAIIYGSFVFYNWSIGKIQVEGWTSIIIILTFTAGIQMVMMGVIGEYLWRTMDESRNRPSFVIDEVY